MPFRIVEHQRLHFGAHTDDPQQQRPPIVLVHGAGGNLLGWPPALRRLPGHTVYALDWPGHGKSEGPGRDTVEGYAEVLRGWAEQGEESGQALPRFVLAGHSMGGGVALAFALRYPHLLAGLVLTATGARLRVNPDILQRVMTEREAVAAQLVEWVHGRQATAAQKRQYTRYFLEIDPHVLYGDWLACDGFDVSSRLGEVTVPTLILVGTQDLMTPVKYSRFLAERIAGADLMVMEGAGHMLMLEQPALVTSAIAGFVERLRTHQPAG